MESVDINTNKMARTTSKKDAPNSKAQKTNDERIKSNNAKGK